MKTQALTTGDRALVEEWPRTDAEFRKLLHEQWHDRDAASLVCAIRNLLP